MKINHLIYTVALLFTSVSCSKYLDVIPDNVATIDNAFAMRNTAEKYLFTCYSWIPYQNSIDGNPAFFGGQELWPVPTSTSLAWGVARGQQNVQEPLLNYWDGSQNGRALYNGIRDCNIFLENIGRVPDMEDYEKARWIAEAKFLKAYYHFWLFQMYGPIPLIDQSLPIDATIDEVRVKRNTIDECVAFMTKLLDEAAAGLPDLIESEASELGRITKPIALCLKAKILVTAASPLFNGNPDYANFKDKDGITLFPATVDAGKWDLAATACREAVAACEAVGFKLYVYQQQLGQTKISDTTLIQMSIRNSVSEKWNSEVIWGNTNSYMTQTAQAALTPRTWDPGRNHNAVNGRYAPPLKTVELFYSDHGVPIDEDKDYDYAGRYNLRVATHDDRYDIKEGYTTVGLHFNRENRFYASIGFDGGIWYGQGKLNDNDANIFYIMSKAGQITSIQVPDYYSVTGYWPKKLINPQNVIEASSYTVRTYPWPVIRLADMYLLYAEALNESKGAEEPDVLLYLNKVRERAGLKTVQESWTNYAKQPNKYQSKEGLREIIHRERQIELALEGNQYWDMRRWKTAIRDLSTPIVGWSLTDKDAPNFYRRVTIYTPTFRQRDYLWPISESSLLRNDRLVQNPGW